VYRNGSQIVTTAETSYTNTGLQPSTTYSYTVSAYDVYGYNSAQSSPPATATTMPPDTQPPSVPTNVTAMPMSPTSIRITWSASTDNWGVKGYKAYRNGNQVGTTSSTSFTNTGLTPSTTYSYTVAAYDSAGNVSAQSSPPAEATTMPLDGEPPSVPTNVSAVTQSSTDIRVNWTASTDNMGVTGYKVYRNGSQVGASSTTTYDNKWLRPKVTYSYTVSAYDAAGNNSAQSSPAATAITTDSVHDLGVLSGSYPYSEGIDLTDILDPQSPTSKVQIGGSSRNSSNKMHPVRWTGSWTSPEYRLMTVSSPTDLDSGLGVDSYARGVNGDGSRVVSDKAVVYKYDGAWTMSALGGTTPIGYDIKPAGDRAVGSMDVGGAAHGAVWTWSGSSWSSPADLGNAGVAATTACGTSASDRICGYRYKSSWDCYQGVVWKWNGSSWALDGFQGDLVSGGRTYTWGINADGTKVVGESGARAYVWEWNGSSWTGTNLGTLSGGSTSAARAVNMDGDVVGYAYDSGGQQRAVRWTKGVSWSIKDLNDVIASDSGWVLRDAKGINDSGWIVGIGAKDGQTHGFLLTSPDGLSPSVPASVTAIAQSPTSIRVTWASAMDNLGVESYRIYRNGNEAGISATTSYRDTGLTPNITYTYTVSAYDWSWNESAQSSPPATATTPQAISIAAAKALPNESTVGFAGVIVTAIYGNCLYVEEADRHSGIKVVPQQMPDWLNVGQTVDIGGTIRMGANKEREIGGAAVTLVGTWTAGIWNYNIWR